MGGTSGLATWLLQEEEQGLYVFRTWPFYSYCRRPLQDNTGRSIMTSLWDAHQEAGVMRAPGHGAGAVAWLGGWRHPDRVVGEIQKEQ